MKKSLWGIVTLIAVLALLPLAAQAAPPADGEAFWRAEYYDNPGLEGHPKFATLEDNLSHDWGEGSPQLKIPADHWSARWTGTRYFERGSYLFVLTVDDGARVWFDGNLIIDAWKVGRTVRSRAKVFVEQAGDHEIQVAYFDHTGQALIYLEEIQLGSPTDIVSSWEAEYFNNRNLEGKPNLVQREAAINYDWSTGSPSPRVTRDNFSVRWTRNTYLLTGNYHARIRHDDGLRIFYDGEIIYDSWHDQAPKNKTVKFYAKEGYHTFVVEYYEHLGIAVAQVDIYGENQ
jgi:hypothetical protein